MAQIRLHAFAEEARELVRTGRYDEAIAICRHILKQYPKHVESYRILAESCLQKGDQEQAADLFKRTLGADPHDFLAYVGLGIIYEEKGLLDEAIWQFERAFEQAPANRQVRQELTQLYGQRDNYERERLKLNRAALGQLYLKGGLEDQAIAEFDEILAQDPERLDIELSKAEALYQANRRREAAQVCQSILNQAPHCLKANLLLGEIWTSSGMQEDGETLLRRAQHMDPENILANEIWGEASPLPLAEVLVERPDDLSELLEEEATAEVAASAEVAEGEEVTTPEVAPWDALLHETPSWPAAEEEAPVEGAVEEAAEVGQAELEAAAPEAEALETTAEATPALAESEPETADETESPTIAALEQEFGAAPDLSAIVEDESRQAALEATMPLESASAEEIMAWVRQQQQADELPEEAVAAEEPPAIAGLELEPTIEPEPALQAEEESESPVIAALEEEFGALPEIPAQQIGEEERESLEASMPPETASVDEIMAWLRQHSSFGLPEQAPAAAPVERAVDMPIVEEETAAETLEQALTEEPAAEEIAPVSELAQQVTPDGLSISIEEPLAEAATAVTEAVEEVTPEDQPVSIEEPLAEATAAVAEIVEEIAPEEFAISIEEPVEEAAAAVAEAIEEVAPEELPVSIEEPLAEATAAVGEVVQEVAPAELPVSIEKPVAEAAAAVAEVVEEIASEELAISIEEPLAEATAAVAEVVEEVTPEELPVSIEEPLAEATAAAAEVVEEVTPEELPVSIEEPLAEATAAVAEVVEEVTPEELPVSIEEPLAEATAAAAEVVEEVTPEELPVSIEEPLAEATAAAAEVVEVAAAPIAEAAPTIADYVAKLAQDAADQPTRLALARAHAASQDWARAAEQYGALAQNAPDLMQDVVADLEAQTQAHPEQLALQQVLGDAYMESGRLQDALDKFNWLLKQVK